MNRSAIYLAMIATAVGAVVGGCRGGTHLLPGPSTDPLAHAAHHFSSGGSPIQHVVVMVQENRTFNDLFATFPGAAGTTTGMMRTGSGETKPIALKKVPLKSQVDLNHIYPAWLVAYRDGNMDAFNLIPNKSGSGTEGTAPYQYVNPQQVKPYWAIARQYVLADHMFQTQGSGSFTAHQDLIRGGTDIDSHDSVIDYPNAEPWGCSAPPNTATSLITTKLKYLKFEGPFPCFTYETLQNLLDAKAITWKYYTPGLGSTGALWNAFLAIDSVYSDKTEWNAHIITPETQIFSDISSGTLPDMSWVIPDALHSDHPGSPSDMGPSWVASVVNAIGESDYWQSTAIVIVWDDWGGFYDAVKPPKLDRQGGPGFRVPMIVVSAYTPSKVSHTVFEFGSILRFVEDTWSLGRLGTTDSTAKSIASLFDFDMAPRAFKKIPSKHSGSFFLHQRPSGLPVDSQ